MREDSSISRYRRRLDDTLTSADLTSPETLTALVKDQILRSSVVENEDYIDKIVETRTKEVSNFLGMLRSASVNDVHGSKNSEVLHGGWKVKQDTEELRVMYREGPEGTPFHTLLAEGYVDGPLDVCLCISWESGLYQKWWPQVLVPTFRILSSQCLQKVRIGEQICLVRMKLSWPLSTREAVIHYFELEYLQEDLVIVLLNSISDLENIDKSTHGFTRDGIPDPQDVVRIDVVGGFALQKVSANRSYFRTIANMDVKLDFFPPALINFVSRQLIGGGFKLYKKEVASVSKGDADFAMALKDPLYTRIGEGLRSNRSSTVAPELLKDDTSFLPDEQSGGETVEVEGWQEIVHNDDRIINSDAEELFVEVKKSQIEIEEIKEDDGEEGIPLTADGDKSRSSPINEIDAEELFVEVKKSQIEIEEIKEDDGEEGIPLAADGDKSRSSPINEIDTHQKIFIRPEVEQALNLLDEVISIFHGYRLNDKTKSLPPLPGTKHEEEESPNSEKIAVTKSLPSEPHKNCSGDGAFSLSTKSVDPEPGVIASIEARNSSASHGSRRTGYSASYSRDANHSKIAPASPDEDVGGANETVHNHNNNALHSSENKAAEFCLPEKIEKEEKAALPLVDATNGFGGKNGRRGKKSRRSLLCCFRSSAAAWQ